MGRRRSWGNGPGFHKTTKGCCQSHLGSKDNTRPGVLEVWQGRDEDLRRWNHISGVRFWILRLGEGAWSPFMLAAPSQHAGSLGPASGSFLCRPHRPILEDKRANHTAGENRTRAPSPGPGLYANKKAQETGRWGLGRLPSTCLPPTPERPSPTSLVLDDSRM